MSDDELIQAIQTRLGNTPDNIQEARRPYPPTTALEFQRFQDEVNLPIPELFRRFYMEIGDGNWGPWSGLCRLGVRGDEDEPHFSVIDMWRSDQYWAEHQEEEPVHILSFCDWGCTVFSVLDLKTGAVGIKDDVTQWQARSLQKWAVKWLSGARLSFKANGP